ncbi:MAG: membrane protein insertase YidC [Clostridia bacterium]|nr:membrane protein insertase YidC [Clostridia bacterium]
MNIANMNIISSGLKQVLSFIDGIVGNYGLSVIIFTLAIRFVLLPLDIKSKKSMKAMEKVKPQQDYIQKKYAQDKELLNRKMTELYKKEGVSPMSGCLPMLLQMPILFCMFTAMRVAANEKTVEMLLGMMNGIEPSFEGFLWIRNVFQPDAFWATVIPGHGSALAAIAPVNGSEILTPENVAAVQAFLASEEYLAWTAKFGADTLIYSAPMLVWTISIPAQFNGLFILPVLSAVSQVLATKMQPAATSGNEQQKSTGKMMQYFFPIFSLWICATSTSAFAIYWVASNLIQIAQTFFVNLYFDKREKEGSTDIKEVN